MNGTSDLRVDSMPFGGFKNSGIGREGVQFAVEAMTEPKKHDREPGLDDDLSTEVRPLVQSGRSVGRGALIPARTKCRCSCRAIADSTGCLAEAVLAPGSGRRLRTLNVLPKQTR